MICMTESEKLLYVHAMEEWERNGGLRWFDLYPDAVQKELIREGYITLMTPK